MVRSRKTQIYVHLPLYVNTLGMARANEIIENYLTYRIWIWEKVEGGWQAPVHPVTFECSQKKKSWTKLLPRLYEFLFWCILQKQFFKMHILFFFISLYIWKILKNKEPLYIVESCRASEMVTDLWQVLNHLTAQRSSLVIACRIPKSLLKITLKTCIIRREGVPIIQSVIHLRKFCMVVCFEFLWNCWSMGEDTCNSIHCIVDLITN